MDYRSLVLARIDYLQAELAALAALVRIEEPVASTPTPPPVVSEPAREPYPAAAVEPVPHEEELPPEPVASARPKPRGRRPAAPVIDYSSWTIDPAQAATLLDVARQTVDRRLKDGKTNVTGGPIDTSKGEKRARWRWASEDDVRRWWTVVK